MTNRELTQNTCGTHMPVNTVTTFTLNMRNRLIVAHASDHNKVVVKGSYKFPMHIGTSWFYLDTDVNVDTTADIDTGAISNGKDYYVYACDNSGTLTFLISLSSSYPSGYSADTSRKIGGFHTLCANVGTISGHTLTGYVANDILPQSVWDLKHRPVCEPEGMVYDTGTNKWVDIYLASGTGVSTASVYGATITDTRNWMDFVDDGHAVKKRLLTDHEFASIAAGSNEETSIVGSADPVTTGGHSDTASRRMISNIGCEDCCGALYQWLLDQSAMYDDAIAAGWYDLAGAKGSLYRAVDTNDVKLHAGGCWDNGTHSGSRCRCVSSYRWYTSTSVSARFLADAQ